MISHTSARQRGLALPVMLIILAVMLIGSAYLIKATNSTTLTTTNLAYESTLNKAADLGLVTGFEWLSATAASNKALLDADQPDQAYVARLDTTQTVNSSAFWNNSKTINSGGLQVEYIIHRACKLSAPFNDTAAGNQCLQTAPNPAAFGSSVGLGSSLSSTALALVGNPQLHYIITARIRGPRGGNVVNQLAVLIGT